MIIALMIGRAGSVGFPKKNTIKILRVDHRGNVYKNLDRL